MTASLCAALAARPAGAHTPPPPEIPRHLVVDNQIFDATPAGFRAYLETIRPAQPDLFAQLAPDVDRLQERVTLGRTLLTAGFAAALVSATYGIVSQKDCVQPPVTDPNFAADTAAWSACNGDNMTHILTFSLIGMGAFAAGLVSWVAISPSRNEFIDLVNRHNRASPTPMQLQLGYDPVQHLARAGAVFVF